MAERQKTKYINIICFLIIGIILTILHHNHYYYMTVLFTKGLKSRESCSGLPSFEVPDVQPTSAVGFSAERSRGVLTDLVGCGAKYVNLQALAGRAGPSQPYK